MRKDVFEFSHTVAEGAVGLNGRDSRWVGRASGLDVASKNRMVQTVNSREFG